MAFMALWIVHLVLNVVGLVAIWSTTFVEVATSPPSPQEGMTELYSATFWDNVQQFWDADAGAVAVIIVFSGLVQPAAKAVVMATIAFRPVTTETREQMLRMQEVTAKMSITPFYVQAILLEAFAYTFALGDGVKAKIYIQVYDGLMCFFVAQLTAAVIINLLRHQQRHEQRSEELASAALLWEHVSVSQDSGGEAGMALRPSGELAAEARDAEGRQLARDWNRLAVVVPCAAACLASFLVIYYYPFIEFYTSGVGARFIVANGPTLRLSLKGIADGLLKECHPWLHGLTYTFWFYVNLVIIPCAIPLLAAADAVLPFLPRLLGHRAGPLGGVGGGEEDALVPAGLSWGSSSQSHGGKPHDDAGAVDSPLPPPASLSDPLCGGGAPWRCDAAWVAEARAVLREVVQLLATWSTGETAVVAVFFVAPNINDVAHWIFNDEKGCKNLEGSTGGLEDCLAVEAVILATGGSLMLLWVFLLLGLTQSVVSGQKGLSRVFLKRTRAAGGGEEGDAGEMLRGSITRASLQRAGGGAGGGSGGSGGGGGGLGGSGGVSDDLASQFGQPARQQRGSRAEVGFM